MSREHHPAESTSSDEELSPIRPSETPVETLGATLLSKPSQKKPRLFQWKRLVKPGWKFFTRKLKSKKRPDSPPPIVVTNPDVIPIQNRDAEQKTTEENSQPGRTSLRMVFQGVTSNPRISGMLALGLVIAVFLIIRPDKSSSDSEQASPEAPLVFDKIEVLPPDSHQPGSQQRDETLSQAVEIPVAPRKFLPNQMHGEDSQGNLNTLDSGPTLISPHDNSIPHSSNRQPKSAWLTGTIEEVPRQSANIQRISHVELPPAIEP